MGQLKFHFRTGECAKTIAVELPFSNPLTHDFSLTEHYYIVAENPVRYCVEIKFYGAFVTPSMRRLLGGVAVGSLTARRSQYGRVIAEK